MASLALTFQNLYETTAKYLGLYGTSITTADATTCKDIVNSAYRRFITAQGGYIWSFLTPIKRLDLVSGQWEYELPEGFSNIIMPFKFNKDTSFASPQECNADTIYNYRNMNTSGSSYPQFYALRPQEHSKTVGQRWDVIFYPEPSSSYVLWYKCRLMPQKLENDADIPLGGADYAQVLQQMCLAEAESFQDEKVDVQEAKATKMLADAIRMDVKVNSRFLGKNTDPTTEATYYGVSDGWTLVQPVEYLTTS
jgi:hypothetical protein